MIIFEVVSHLDTVAFDTPIYAAKSSCVIPILYFINIFLLLKIKIKKEWHMPFSFRTYATLHFIYFSLIPPHILSIEYHPTALYNYLFIFFPTANPKHRKAVANPSCIRSEVPKIPICSLLPFQFFIISFKFMYQYAGNAWPTACTESGRYILSTNTPHKNEEPSEYTFATILLTLSPGRKRDTAKVSPKHARVCINILHE